MNITKYIVNRSLEMLDTLFLEGDIIYISESMHTMDGNFDYSRKVFNSDKKYLGRIRSSYFDDRIKNSLIKIKQK